MSGVLTGPPGSSSSLKMPQNISDSLSSVGANLPGAQQQLSDAAGDAKNRTFASFGMFDPKLNNQFGQYNPNLNTEFGGPQFSNDLDSFSQNVVSQGLGDLNNQRSAQNANIASNARLNPALSQVLQAQNNAQSQLAGNPMLFQAAANQRARQGQEYQLGTQAQALTNANRLSQAQQMAQFQQMGNNTNLQQSQANANLQGMSNAAVGQQFGYNQGQYNNYSNLLGVLGGLGSLTGVHSNDPTGPGANGLLGSFGSVGGFLSNPLLGQGSLISSGLQKLGSIF